MDDKSMRHTNKVAMFTYGYGLFVLEHKLSGKSWNKLI